MYGPMIEGSICRMRPPRADEATLMAAWFQDAAVTANILLRFPPSLKQEEEWLDRASRDSDTVVWAIEHAGRCVGTTSIYAIDWQQQHGTHGIVIGDKTAWGKGIGREAMRLRTEYAFTVLPLRKLKSGYVAGNEASRHIQEGAGYRRAGRFRKEVFTNGRWCDLILTELLREDWARRRRSAGPSA